MKRLIFLKIDINQIFDNLSKAKQAAQEKELIVQVVKEFKQQAKNITQVKVLKDYLPQAQVLIEFPDAQYQEVYEALVKIEIVEYIDSILNE